MAHKNVFSKRILKKPVYAYASPELANLKKGFPLSLDNAPVIVPTEHSKIRSDVEDFFNMKKIKPNMIAETQDTSLQKILASKGDGVIFLPNFTTKELVQNEKLVKLGKVSGVYSEYYLVFSKRVIENPALDLILKQNFDKMRLG